MIKFSDLMAKKASPAGASPASARSTFRVPEKIQPLPQPSTIEVPVDEVHLTGDARLVVTSDPRGPGADRFRYLRMRLNELQALSSAKTLVVTSPLPRDGKSTVALNLAVSLAGANGARVLLVEADLRNPSVSQRLGLAPRPGLAECLEQDLDPMRCIVRVEPLGLYVLQAGQAKRNPTELLASDALGRMLEALTPHFTWVVADAPPVAPLADAVLLSRSFDAALVVVRAGQTPQEAVEQTVDQIGSQRVAGIIFNAAEHLNKMYSKYGAYYGS